MHDYRLAPDGAPPLVRSLARGWLWLGVAALIGSGLLAILLVLSRTPGIQNVFPLRDFFRSALVVHVDLSVLIWFMAFASVLWTLAGNGALALLGHAALWLAAVGTLLMTVSPFFPDAHPLLNNYIPVLEQPVFFAGLGIAGLGFALAILRALLTIRPGVGPGGGMSVPPGGLKVSPGGTASLQAAILLGAIAGAVALAAVVASWLQLPAGEGQAYWEAFFWGGGHALQFQHALLMLVAWFWLASALGEAPALGPRAASALFALAALPILAVPAIQAQWPAGHGLHTAYFARLMEAGHPLMLPLMAFAAHALWRARGRRDPAKSAFGASFALFAVGGTLAYMIKGVNVVIPAHYHGSIVGVTLAFMGLAYVLLPRLGFGDVANQRMACWQPYVYGGGQLIHILGLAWSGGYGVQRKVAGAEQVLTTLPQKIGMGMMGLGGLIAIIGGIMFVLVCLRAMWRGPAD